MFWVVKLIIYASSLISLATLVTVDKKRAKSVRQKMTGIEIFVLKLRLPA